MKKILIIIYLSLSLFATEKKDITNLSQEIKTLLSQEMVFIQKAMKDIFSNIIAGEYESISKTATTIENSFILKKKLTVAQRKELQSKVPKAFLTLDKNFHETAGKLANAAEFEDKKEVNLYFSQMTQSCVKCHSSFAKNRFPKFQE